MKKSFKKRIKVTKNGKMVRRKMAQNHFRAKRSGKQKRNKRRTVLLTSPDVRVFRKYLTSGK